MSLARPHPLHAHDHRDEGPPATGSQRRRWQVRGTVQGVGFRPFVHHLATDLGLAGHVRNAGGTVLIEAHGPEALLDAFEARLCAEAPPMATITTLVQLPARPGGTPAGFVIEQSLNVEAQPVHQSRATRPPAHRDVPPDAAICDACLAELFDPSDRRNRYPFINCVDCGPRASVIDALPYDRARTAMARFALCAACAAQYRDPADRRFHAEAMACPDCGPRLIWRQAPMTAAREEPSGEAALGAAVTCVAAGGIIALKSVGGYQFVCDATNRSALALLRTRTCRPSEPLPVMVADLKTAARYARLSVLEERLLCGPARPIVLAEPRPPHGRSPIAHGVRGCSPALALSLPTTALHHLLLRALARPLIVTGARLRGQPLIIDEESAGARLSAVADGICGHDRPILARYQDSVAAILADRPAILRRARGYAPAPLPLPLAAPRALLALGARREHTFTLAQGPIAITSAPLGDLEDTATQQALTRGVRRLTRLHAIEPEYLVHDLHPGSLPARYAARFPASRRIAVQHHHAHIASCAAEHALSEDVIGVAYDTPGLGEDGTLWGGEIMVANLTGYTRLGRFARAPLPGGANATPHPAHTALGYLTGLEPLGGPRFEPAAVRAFTDRLDPRETEAVLRMITQRTDSPQASSAALLFDAAAAILALPEAHAPDGAISFEGEAALALANAAHGACGPALAWRLTRVDGLWVYDPRPTLAALLDGAARGEPADRLAAAFHQAVAEATLALVEHAVRVVGPKPVCLSGAVWQNRTLTQAVIEGLETAGLDVLLNQRVPCNDGGISYGQAAIGAARLRER